MGAFADHRAGAQARVWSDDGAGGDRGAFQMRMAADARTGLHRHAGSEHHKGFDFDIILDLRVVGQEHRVGRDHRDTVRQQGGAAALLELGFGIRQFSAAVDASDRDFVGHGEGAFDAIGARQSRHIGQVIFALGVVVLEQRGPVEEFLRIGGVTAGIAQHHALFGFRSVLEFDNAVEEAVRRQQHAAIRARIGRFKGQQSQPGADLGRKAFGDHLGGDQRHVAIDDQQGAGKIGQRIPGACGGMAGAQLLMLDGAVAAQRFGILAHRVACGRGHHHDARHIGAAQRSHHMAQQRQARHLVQHLGQRGFHPRSLSRSQYDSSPCHGVRVVPSRKKIK